MQPKLLKEIVQSPRKLRKEISFLKNNPEQRRICCGNAAPKYSVVAFAVDGNTWDVIGVK
ncbi:MAG: hypothetical protein ABIF85_07670 [Nanoarchaeota archaeon]|nr:hypothetical protein [Nanoarchaeota archaeon]MCG2724291.1 hypothetical protein [archaeon]